MLLVTKHNEILIKLQIVVLSFSYMKMTYWLAVNHIQPST